MVFVAEATGPTAAPNQIGTCKFCSSISTVPPARATSTVVWWMYASAIRVPFWYQPVEAHACHRYAALWVRLKVAQEPGSVVGADLVISAECLPDAVEVRRDDGELARLRVKVPHPEKDHRSLGIFDPVPCQFESGPAVGQAPGPATERVASIILPIQEPGGGPGRTAGSLSPRCWLARVDSRGTRRSTERVDRDGNNLCPRGPYFAGVWSPTELAARRGEPMY